MHVTLSRYFATGIGRAQTGVIATGINCEAFIANRRNLNIGFTTNCAAFYRVFLRLQTVQRKIVIAGVASGAGPQDGTQDLRNTEFGSGN